MADGLLEQIREHYSLLMDKADSHNNSISFYKYELESIRYDLNKLNEEFLTDNEKLSKRILLSAVESALKSTDA